MSPSPPNQGYTPPDAKPSISPAAPIARAAAITANPGAHELPTGPRSVVDQQDLQCCVSCALSGVMESLYPDWPALAPLFHYYVTRYQNGGSNADGSLVLSTALATLAQQGICVSTLHSPRYTPAGAAQPPSAPAIADALTRVLARRGLLSRYQKIGGPSLVANIRDILNQNCPVVLGIQLPMGYPKEFPKGNMEWRDPDNPARSDSFHCVLVTGYDDVRQSLHVHDSHGVDYFDKGRWWMGYRVVDSSVVAEAYRFTR